jgi:DNA primase
MNNSTEVILSNVNVIDVLVKHDIKIIKRSHDEILIHCPFHDDSSASLYINEKTRLFKCFGCSMKGNVITFISKLEKISYIEVVQKLLGDSGVSNDYASKLNRLKESFMNEKIEDEGKSNKFEIYKDFIDFLPKVAGKELQYLNSRNIITEVLEEMNIRSLNLEVINYLKSKYANKDLLESGLFVDYTNNGGLNFISIFHSIVFPFYYDTEIVGIQLRRLDNENPRYLNIGELICPYNINIVLKSEVIFLCEGIPDCLSLLTLGKPSVGIIGAENFKTEWKSYFIGKSIFILFDNDEPGRKGAKHIQEILGDEIKTKLINLPENIKDVNDFLKTKTFQYISSIRKGSVLKF